MRNLSVAILFFISFQTASLGQVAVGGWMDHFSLKDVTKIVTHNEFVYGASSNGIIIYDRIDNSISKLTKANGLSDIRITSIGIDNSGTLIIGYDNGNIDLVFKNRIVNMRDLLMKNMQGSKTINKISTFGGKAYLSCNFGIVVLNIEKNEIADTYVLSSNSSSNPVNNTIIQDSIIYSATSKGVFSSTLKNSRIQIFSSWNKISDDTQSYCDLAFYNSGLVVSKGKRDALCTLFLYKNGVKTTLFSTPSFREIGANPNLLVVDRTAIYILDSGYQLIKSIPSGLDNYLSVAQDNDNFYSGKTGAGIIMYSNFLVDETNYQEILPNGPFSDTIYDINSSSYGVWVSPGGVTNLVTNSWNNLGIEPYYSFFNGFDWINYTKANFQDFSGETDLLRIAINPKIPSSISICSWGSGIFDVEKNETLTHYDQHNSILKNVFKDDNNYVRVGGIAIDKNGTTWMTNSRDTTGGIVVKTVSDKWYSYNYKTVLYHHSMGQILAAKNNFKWSFFPKANGTKIGIFVWDDNGTLDNSSDDRYRGPEPASTDFRNKGELRLWNSNREEITNMVNCLAEESSGVLWIGTDKGPLVYYRPNNIFDEKYPVATQINIPRNDGSGFGDYLLGNEVINAIAIDGANRKWFGTSSSGIYLISSDGVTQIEHFTVDNSPLPSNNIVSISYEEKTGQIFIGTLLGLVSYRGTAVKSETTIESPYVFPNPVKPGYRGLITIKGIMTDSDVKVTDVSGNIVNVLKSLGGQAIWDGNNFNGERVSSGIYYFLISNSDGSETGKTKVLIVN